MSIGPSGSVSASNAVNGIENVKMNGANTMSERPNRKTYTLNRLYRTLTCPNPEFCDEEHNLCGDESHHYGCLCNGCTFYYYTKLK
jgi:hypothetical protein